MCIRDRYSTEAIDPPSLFSMGEALIALIQLFLDDPSNKPHFCNLYFFICLKINKFCFKFFPNPIPGSSHILFYGILTLFVCLSF